MWVESLERALCGFPWIGFGVFGGMDVGIINRGQHIRYTGPRGYVGHKLHRSGPRAGGTGRVLNL